MEQKMKLPPPRKPKNVVSFSGGQTSGLMLRMLMDANPKDFDKKFLVIFENTGREHDKTLEFINNVSISWGIEIIWLEYQRIQSSEILDEWVRTTSRKNLLKAKAEKREIHWHNVVDFESASRIGDGEDGPFDRLLKWMDVLPNVVARACSRALKTQVLFTYLWKNGIYDYHDYIGIRKDEDHRAIEIIAKSPKYRSVHFPLVDAGITKQDVDKFWDSQPFKLEIPNYLGNCDGCFLKKRWKLIQTAKQNPNQFQWWIDWEIKRKNKGQGGRWKNSESYQGILNDALHDEFCFMEDKNEIDIPCSCAVVDSTQIEL